jgi:phosphatidylinositol phospholipase C epsilon
MKRNIHTLQVPVVYAAELESLHKLLHFPEEVALRLTATEHHLFYQVPPIDYLRQVTLDLAAGNDLSGVTAAAAACAANTAAATAAASSSRPSVRDLIKRFNEVSLISRPFYLFI